MNNTKLIDKLNLEKSLKHNQWVQLISSYTDDDAKYSCDIARKIALDKFSNKVFFRGIIEFTNICKNDCYYCGIRSSNQKVCRYRLSKDDILDCCTDGYKYGYRTFVLQGGEDSFFNDERLCDIVKSIKSKFSDCAVTLSVGERSRESYEKLFNSGADRYLLRHETATCEHYQKLHPKSMSFENRIKCLYDLKEIGYQTGCGMMVGSPYQTVENIADDMLFIEKFKPHMIGMGPFIAHCDTPFSNFCSGSVDLTVFLLSLCRIMLPSVLLPATTALGSLNSDGRKRGVLAGCNVVMPNLSPLGVRKKYLLYNNKAGVDLSAKESIERLKKQMDEIGYEVVISKGDFANCDWSDKND